MIHHHLGYEFLEGLTALTPEHDFPRIWLNEQAPFELNPLQRGPEHILQRQL